MTEYSLWYKKRLPASHLFDALTLLTGQHMSERAVHFDVRTHTRVDKSNLSTFFILISECPNTC